MRTSFARFLTVIGLLVVMGPAALHAFEWWDVRAYRTPTGNAEMPFVGSFVFGFIYDSDVNYAPTYDEVTTVPTFVLGARLD